MECNQIKLQLYNQVLQAYFPSREINENASEGKEVELLTSLATNFKSAGITALATIDFF